MQFLNVKEAAARIASIAKRGKALDADVHQVACSTLVHVREHGDYTLIEKLIRALPAQSRHKALAYWYNHFAKGAMVVEVSKAGVKVKLSKERTPEMFRVDEAVETPFWSLTTEKDVEPLTIAQWLKRIERMAQYEAKEGQPQRFAPELIGFAKKILPVLNAAKDADVEVQVQGA